MPSGGARPNAGRPSKQKRAVKKVLAETILETIDEMDAWLSLLTATTITSVVVIGGEDGERESQTVPDNKIRLEALKYLTNRRDGMPAQSVFHGGDPADIERGQLPEPKDLKSSVQ